LRKCRNRFSRDAEIYRIALNSDALITGCYSRSDSGTPTHEWIEYNAYSQGKRGPNDLPHEALGLE